MISIGPEINESLDERWFSSQQLITYPSLGVI